MELIAKSKVPALTRAVAILDIISRLGQCNANQLVSELGMPKSTVYLLLEELKNQRLVTQSNSGNYRLGLRLLELGSQVSRQLDLRNAALPHLKALMHDTGLFCHLGVLDGDTQSRKPVEYSGPHLGRETLLFSGQNLKHHSCRRAS